MAIQPIDLQTMYSQMSNVASKVSHEQHGAQMTASMQQQSAVLQNSQSVKTVQKAAGEESKTGLIKDDGHQSQNGQSDEKKSSSQDQDEKPAKTEFREEYLGKHIDITR